MAQQGEKQKKTSIDDDVIVQKMKEESIEWIDFEDGHKRIETNTQLNNNKIANGKDCCHS